MLMAGFVTDRAAPACQARSPAHVYATRSSGGSAGSIQASSECLAGSWLTGSPSQPRAAAKNHPMRTWPPGPR